MDNLAHTLAGAALGEAGLKQKTGLGLATLIITANLPDIDALGLLFGENLAWRRGWTHGPIALIVLPIVLTVAMIAFDRWQTRRGTRPEARLPVRAGWLLALAYIGILSHPLLDFLNTYGIRCLMPFSDRWFYGDALFIIDVWMWSALAIGVWFSRRRRRNSAARPGRPAIAALATVAFYSGAMGTGSLVAERMVAREVAARGLGTPETVVASPVPIDPFRRDIVYSLGDRYGFGTFRWAPAPRMSFEAPLVATNLTDPVVARAAAASKDVADFLYWSRLPFAEVTRSDGEASLIVGDARYNKTPEGRFSATATVPE